MDEQSGLYLIRPVLDGSVTAGYATDQGMPAFRCVIKDGFFLAIGFESGFYSEEVGSEDIVLIGLAYVQTPSPPGQAFVKTRPPNSLPSEVLQAVLNLKSKRLLVSGKISEWRSFLDWQMDIVHQRQFGLRYHAVQVDETAQRLRFRVSTPRAEWRRFKRRNSFAAEATPLAASKDPQRWMPVENARGVFLGKLFVPKAHIKGLTTDSASKCEADEQVQCIVEAHLDPDTWNRCCNTITQEGFLASAIYMDIIPFRRQKTALSRLVRIECVNPRLADFLFEASEARIPENPVIVPARAEVEYPVELNELQRCAIAKALAAPDLFVLQGPPGTGKTRVLSQVCDRAVSDGKRVLVASQANVAVDNILSRIARRPQVRPLRIGNGHGDDETQSRFSENQVICQWLSSVRRVCRVIFTEREELAAAQEQIKLQWIYLAEMVQEHDKLLQGHVTAKQQLRQMDSEFAELTETLGELENQASTYSAAVSALEYVLNQLSICSTLKDLGEWVQLIYGPERAKLFGPLTRWHKGHSLPAVVKGLFSDSQPSDDNALLAAENRSRAVDLLRWFRRCFVRQQKEPQPSFTEAEPNWAVEWIESACLLNNLRRLQTDLPTLLRLCEEGERLCVAASVSQVAEQTWAQLTGSLHSILEVWGSEASANVLAIENIATSLQPKKRFAKRLAKARMLLHETLRTVPQMTDELTKALAGVAQTSAKYIGKLLAETTEHIRRTQSALDTLTRQQSDTAEMLTDTEGQIRQLESSWADTLALLPDELRACAEAGPLLIGSKSLEMLDAARSSYTTDTESQLTHHRLWGPIQAKWLHLLERPTDVDRKRLTPLYLKRCNIVGATCSYSGNYRGFLSRTECARFDIVIIDEVSKATPPELLVPALLGGKLILAGDYRQLAPTFKEGPRLQRSFAELAEIDTDFEKVARFKDMLTASLFKKLIHDAPEILKQELIEQHRMHPQIMDVINQFYDNQLQCGITNPDTECDHDLVIKTRSGEFLTRKNHVLWVDTSRDSRGRLAYERQVGTSKANPTEAESIVRLVKLLNHAAHQAGKAPGSVELGIITFYGPQIKLIRQKLDKLNPANKKFLRICLSTVDNFQGIEQSMVIVSLVRSKRGRIGNFAKTFERINVAMSRAQKLLVIFGAIQTFAHVEVPLSSADGKTVRRKCYGHILDVVKRHGGMRRMQDL
jgi:hypothetical protein